MPPIEHFRSKGAEMRNLAWRHIHGVPYTATEAVVAGKKHKVKHSGNKKRKAIDARQRKKVGRKSKKSKKKIVYAKRNPTR